MLVTQAKYVAPDISVVSKSRVKKYYLFCQINLFRCFHILGWLVTTLQLVWFMMSAFLIRQFKILIVSYCPFIAALLKKLKIISNYVGVAEQKSSMPTINIRRYLL